MKKNKQIVLSVLGIIVLVILIIGTTYAGFSKTSSGGNNSISSGTITMAFQEPSNNVVITNAMPTSDGYGSTTHFDFSITGTAKAAIPITYEISITEKSGNTIDPQYVRIGLKKNGTIVTGFYDGKPASALIASSARNGSKILVKDQLTLAQSGSNYTATDNYQLFLWINLFYPMPTDGTIESYSITVNVNSSVEAVGVSNTRYVVSETQMSIGNTLPNGVNGRDTAALAMNDWVAIAGSEKPFYLKHVFNNNNEIEESYVEFVVTDAMVTDNPGMVAGTYALRGGDDAVSYISNFYLIQDVFGAAFRCEYWTDGINCSVPGLYVHAEDDGSVGASSDNSYCSISYTGKSYCRNNG